MKLFKLGILLAILFAHTHIFAIDPEPYASVRNLPYQPYYIENGYLLFNLINSRSAAVVIDVGSVDGGAARYIAQNAPETITQIYAVQDWGKSEQVRFPYQQFLSNVKQENTTNLIIPIRMSSQEAATGLSVIADVIFFNATFQDAVDEDILAWSSHLTANGVICGNNWNDPTVEMGVTQAAASLNLILNISGDFWSLTRN